MISKFFLGRPIFAAVISIILVLAGVAAMKTLPIEQYPNIAPPLILVSTSYPGATAQTMSDTVAAPLEQQINGVEDMIYMYSQNTTPGNISLNVYFDLGVNPDMALTNTQNRVDLAMSQLPLQVQQQGISVTKQAPTILMFVSISSPDGVYDEIFVNNYATIHVADTLQRLKGVSSANVLNALDYSIRIWLRPDLLAQLKLTTTDVVNAIKGQNEARSIGELGQPPNMSPVPLTLPVDTLGRLSTPEQYENIILRANTDGSLVQIKDVGRVELGAQSYSVQGKVNGQKAALIAVYQDYGANALDVAERIKTTMEELKKTFPPGLQYNIPYDTTPFIKLSIEEVFKTLLEAVFLVSLVILIFLQNWRATLVPVIAMLVSIIGTFAGMHALGFSINTLTLFGMVLAVGIVVDDAIVVVENVEHNMRKHKLNSKDAALKTMSEVSGPVIAIVCVLCAVFIPIAFVGGIAGQLYRQFAITISISVVISGFVALTLSPVLAALLLKTYHPPGKLGQWFNKGFEAITQVYLVGAHWIMRHACFGICVCLLLITCIGVLFYITPTALVPDEDQGYILASAFLPDASNIDRINTVSAKMETMAVQSPAVAEFIGFSGFSLLEMIDRNSVGAYFINLKNWKERKAKELQASSIIHTLNQEFSHIPEAQVMAFNPPAIPGIGIVGGFEFWIVNESEADMLALERIAKDFLDKARTHPSLSGLSTAIDANNLSLYVDLDTAKTRAYQVSVGDVYDTLQVLLGSLFVNYFNKYGRVFQVIVQADPDARATVEDIGQVYVRSALGSMIPLQSLMSTTFSKGPTLISRFNGFPAAKITGGPAPGYSSGEAMQAMENLARELLPPGMTFAWSGQAYQEKTAGNSAAISIGAGLVMVFLVLAALYERWSLPFAILLAVPFGLFGAFSAIWARGMYNDVYFQIGLVALIGLAAKNAILIVEFARMKVDAGMDPTEAALDAAKLRFRAIIMTSLTFILGVLPLVTSQGAGAASRHSVGTGVMGGMCAATFFAIFFVPLFFKLIAGGKSRHDSS